MIILLGRQLLFKIPPLQPPCQSLATYIRPQLIFQKQVHDFAILTWAQIKVIMVTIIGRGAACKKYKAKVSSVFVTVGAKKLF